jgi:oxygen-independent coproporphyrinogen-3 oxidase
MEEFMFLGLRMTDGVSVEEYQRRFGEPVEKRFGEVIEKHLRQGLICRKTVEVGGASLRCGVPCQESAKTDGAIDHRLALTEYGLDVANYVMADYIL